MEKKSIIFLFFELVTIFLWLLFVGVSSGQSAFYGDVNLIDEGQYAAWVSHMFHGMTPYKDFYIQYSPLQFFPIYALMKFFGQSIFFVRLYTTILGSFLGIIIAIAGLRYLKVNRIVELITIFFLTLIPGINIRYWLAVLCFFMILKSFDKKSILYAILSGVTLSVLFLESFEVAIFTSIIVFIYFLIWILIDKRFENIKLIWASFIGFFVSMLGFIIIAIKGGWLKNYLETTFEIITSLSGINLPNGQGLPIFPSDIIQIIKFTLSKQSLFYWTLLIVLIFISIMLIRLILRKWNTKDILVSMILFLTLFLYASIIGRSGHYFLIVPFVLVCGAYLLSIVKTSRLMLAIFLLTFILYGMRHIIIFRFNMFPIFHGMNSAVDRILPIKVSNKQSNDISRLQQYFNTNSKSSDKIYVFNNAPALYFLLNRENSTRYDLPLLASTQEKRLEIVSSLQQNKPKFIIDDTEAWAVDDISDTKRMPEIIRFIKQQYFVITTIGHYRIYQRK